MKEKRIIAHLDMDAFFAAVEERDSPQFKGLPIVVGSDPQNGSGRGVVSTANYKARKYGIRSALPISKAWQLSQQAKKAGQPAAIFLPVDFLKYERASQKIMQILRRFSDQIEQASIDEAYFDLTPANDFKNAAIICQKIQETITKEEKLTASIGLASNKLIAKIASDIKKPNGLTIITPDDGEEFLADLDIRKIPGIGSKTQTLFNAKKIYKVNDLKKFSIIQMEQMLGKWGISLYQKIRGYDETPLCQDYKAKSIGEQQTFLADTLDFKIVHEEMEKMCNRIFAQLSNNAFASFRTIVVTVRFQGFITKNRSHTLNAPNDSLKTLKFEALKLLMPFFDRRENPALKPIRLIGVRIEKLI